MSYEGYSQFWCKNGHYWAIDCNELMYKEEKQKCPICNYDEVFQNMVNITNGSLNDNGNRIDGFIQPKVIQEEKLICKCGNEHICSCSVYEVPEVNEGKMRKILCICGYGNVRSVAMAQFIKELHGKYRPLKDEEIEYEAIAIGEKVTSTETMNMLKEWADEIIDVTEYLPKDLWHNPRHKEIMAEVKKIWETRKVKKE